MKGVPFTAPRTAASSGMPLVSSRGFIAKGYMEPHSSNSKSHNSAPPLCVLLSCVTLRVAMDIPATEHCLYLTSIVHRAARCSALLSAPVQAVAQACPAASHTI